MIGFCQPTSSPSRPITTGVYRRSTSSSPTISVTGIGHSLSEVSVSGDDWDDSPDPDRRSPGVIVSINSAGRRPRPTYLISLRRCSVMGRPRLAIIVDLTITSVTGSPSSSPFVSTTSDRGSSPFWVLQIKKSTTKGWKSTY